ncbi:MAG: hypothetical protein WAN52_08290 [Pseudolabrys sp.]
MPPASIPTRPAAIPTPDTAGVTQAFAQAAEKLPPPPPARPSFQSMFSDRVNQPLAEKVNTLWGGTNAGAAIPKSGGEGV